MLLRCVWALALVAGAVATGAADEPKTAADYRERGFKAADRRDYDTAIRSFTVAIRLDPKDPFAFQARGYCWF